MNENQKDTPETIVLHSTDLPTLAYSRSRHLNDFEVERVEFEVKGHHLDEAVKAMAWLLAQHKSDVCGPAHDDKIGGRRS